VADLHEVVDAVWNGPVDARPWGWYAILGQPEDEQIAAVKVLRVDAGQMLSLQTHELRRERWIPVTPGLGAIIGDEEILLEVGTAYEVPAGVPHRLFSIGVFGGTVIELMYGTYDENDIVRLHDTYNR